MNIVTESIEFGGQHLLLSNQRVVFWEAEKALILSDIHIGKTAHFRKNGIPIPDQILVDDINRLTELIEHFQPTQIIFVGDLFHAGVNMNFDVFRQWLAKYQSIQWILVKGNHDRLKASFYEEMNIEVVPEMTMNGLHFTHEPTFPGNEQYCISGHLHAGVSYHLKGRQKLKLPCYILAHQQLILPAFSLFTGLYCRYTFGYNQIYAFTNEEIWCHEVANEA